MTIKEGVETLKVAGPDNKLSGGKTSLGGESEDQINQAITVRNSVQEVSPGASDTHLKKSSKERENGSNNSDGFRKVDKSPDEVSKHVPHYLRPATSSCHHYCKYGVKAETSNHSHSHAKVRRKTSPSLTNTSPDAVKSAVPKTHKPPQSISSSHSPVGSSSTAVGDSSKVSPKGKIAVNKSEYQVKARSDPSKLKTLPSGLPPKSSPEKKTKPSSTSHIAVSKSSKPAINHHDNSKRATPSPNHAVNGHGISKKATPPSNAKKATPPSNGKQATPPSNVRRATPSSSPNGHGNTKTVQISDKKAISKTEGNPPRKVDKKVALKSFSPRSIIHDSSKPQEEQANNDGVVEVCAHKEEKGIIDRVCANEGEDVHNPYEHSHISDELSDEEHATGLLEHIGNLADGHSVEEYCNECNDEHVVTAYAHTESTDSDKIADEKNADFEAYGEGSYGFEHYAESLAEEYLDQDLVSEYSEEYSEYTESPESEPNDGQEHQDRNGKEPHKADHEGGSQSLEKQRFRRGLILAGEDESQSFEKQRFRRGQILDAEEENRRAERRRFTTGRVIDYSNKKPEPENVELRHQEEQRRKAAEEFLLNHKIEEAVIKLSHTRKSKVKTLVGAFETVISLKESETIEPKHVGAKDSSQMNTPQECTKDSSLSGILHEGAADLSQLSSLEEYTQDSDQLSTLQVHTKGTED